MSTASNQSDLVLITGASGYLAMHVVDHFLKAGYKVRGTVRSLKDLKKVQALKSLDTGDKLELVEADLLDKDSWSNALKGVTILVHVASPFPIQPPTDENELIRPAVNGTLNVFNAAFDAGVKLAVLTSSVASIVGDVREERIYTENDWPNPEIQPPYAKSKVLAEKAAWDFVEEKKKSGQKCFELTVINPALIFGPILHGGLNTLGTSETLVLSILNGSMEKILPWNFGMCDVRDVALAHLKAAFLPAAVGQRHIISSYDSIEIQVVSDILHEEFGQKGYSVSRQRDKGSMIKVNYDNSRMLNVLKIDPIPLKKTVIDMANAFIQSGLAKRKE